MRNLLNFLIKYGAWFLFTLYVLLSCLLLMSQSAYRQSALLTSANVVAGSIYGVTSEVTGYFHLKSINEELQLRNASLENEVLNLKDRLAELAPMVDTALFKPNGKARFDFISASVINNSTRHPRNYFTINRGVNDGVETGMGVVDQNGVVGIVNVAAGNTARVISLLNETQRFSVKIKDTDYVGSLTWKGSDPRTAYMEEVPRHVKFHAGDTIVTSGYSTTFPEGIPVGRVLNRIKGADDNFFIFKIRLASDFNALSTVRIIKDFYKPELDSLKNHDIKTGN